MKSLITLTQLFLGLQCILRFEYISFSRNKENLHSHASVNVLLVIYRYSLLTPLFPTARQSSKPSPLTSSVHIKLKTVSFIQYLHNMSPFVPFRAITPPSQGGVTPRNIGQNMSACKFAVLSPTKHSKRAARKFIANTKFHSFNAQKTV